MLKSKSDSNPILLFLLLCLSATIVMASESKFYVVSGSGSVALLSEAETGSRVASVAEGEEVTLLEKTKYDLWAKVKTGSGKVGFIESKFLSPVSPSDLSQVEMLGLFGFEGENAILAPLLSVFQKNWKHPILERLQVSVAISSKKKSEWKTVSLRTGAPGPELQYESDFPIGCQGRDGWKVTWTKANTTSPPYLAFTQGLSIQALPIQDASESFPFQKALDEYLVTHWKDASPKEKSNAQLDEVFRFQLPSGSTYYSLRLAVNNTVGEIVYKYLLLEVGAESKVPKFVFQKGERLPPDLQPYGGSFHFLGAILDFDNKQPILIFLDYGYDSSIYSFYRLGKDGLQLIQRGGGDAC